MFYGDGESVSTAVYLVDDLIYKVLENIQTLYCQIDFNAAW